MADSDSKVLIDQTARPIRLGLLVDPTEIDTVRRAVGICTVQWGGVFNPLIPVFKRRPAWWAPPIRKVSGPPTASQAAENTIRSWDPDFLVDFRKADPARRRLGGSVESLSPPIDASVAGGRRLNADAICDLHSALSEAGGQVFINSWLTPWGEETDGAQRRPLLVGGEKRDEVRVEGGRVSFDLLPPDFLDDDLRRRAASWANVIRVGFGWPDMAEAFPPELGEVGDLLNSWDHSRVAAREEGLVCVAGAMDRRVSWRLPSGAEVFASLASNRGFTPRISEPGQVAREIVRRLGGLTGVGMVRHPSLVEALDKAVRSESRSAPRPEIWKAVMQARGSDAQAAHLLKVLLERRVIDAGVTIRCPTCAKSNWYGPGDMGLRLQCERCLNDFPFPGHDPPHRDQWAYRPRGGFASPGYAMGSYSALLSLRLLSGSMDRISWAASMSLNSSIEVDFAMWRQRAPVLSAEPSEWSLLLGECKSHGEFKEQDLDRMKRVRAAFPEAILVFASLRETLSQDEVAALTEFARPPDRESAAHHPDVMILTAMELFADHLPGAWHEAGGRAAQLAPEHLIGSRPEAERLADLTQQIHLGLGSFESWRYSLPG